MVLARLVTVLTDESVPSSLEALNRLILLFFYSGERNSFFSNVSMRVSMLASS